MGRADVPAALEYLAVTLPCNSSDGSPSHCERKRITLNLLTVLSLQVKKARIAYRLNPMMIAHGDRKRVGDVCSFHGIRLIGLNQLSLFSGPTVRFIAFAQTFVLCSLWPVEVTVPYLVFSLYSETNAFGRLPSKR